jgi:phosphatidate phosphatase APP1
MSTAVDVHGVPEGPLFLKDWSPTVLGKHRVHKLEIIRRLLRTYPDLPFVLIGDSGEEDPEIYSQVVREHPGRVRAIYIRDVTSAERDAEVRAIAAEVRGLGVEMVAVPDTATARPTTPPLPVSYRPRRYPISGPGVRLPPKTASHQRCPPRSRTGRSMTLRRCGP